MPETSPRLFHTNRSASRDLGGLPDESGVIGGLLKQAIKRGIFTNDEVDGLEELSLQELDAMDEAIEGVLERIKESRDALPIRETRAALADRLLFARSMLAQPLAMLRLRDEEADVFMPFNTLNGIGLEGRLHGMQTQVRNAKIKFTHPHAKEN